MRNVKAGQSWSRSRGNCTPIELVKTRIPRRFGLDPIRDGATSNEAQFAVDRPGSLQVSAEGSYAASIHKSQGSEYPAVVIPVMTQHYAMLKRNLLYTGVTRGKRLVVLVGQKKAIAIAVRNVSGRRRWSKLGEWLRSDALTLSH